MSLVVLVLGVCFRISTIEWLFVVSAVFRVLSHEAINTSVEELSDVCESKKDLDIKNVKDTAAGSVLLASVYSLTVAGIIFLPRIWALFFS